MLKGVTYPRGLAPVGADVLWRCEPRRYSYIIDAEREEYGVTDMILEMFWIEVTKWTPCGAWVGTRWVNLNATKQWASTTQEKALEGLYYRNRRLRRVLTARLTEANDVFHLLEKAMGRVRKY